MPKKSKENVRDLYLVRRKAQREKRALRKKALGIEDDHADSSMQRKNTIASKTKRAIKIELFQSKSKSSGTDGKETSIEAFVRNILEEEKIKFIEQKAISFVNVDFALSDKKIAIQVHGDYFHCNPRLYPEPKNSSQRKNLEKDKQATELIKKAGYVLIEIWELDIKKRPDAVRKGLLSAIEKGTDASSVDWE